MNELIIEKDKIINNINEIKKRIKTEDYTIIAVVKGNAYGHDIIPFTKILIENGINYLAVATYEEACILRDNKIQENILLLTPYTDEEIIKDLIKKDITFTIDTFETFKMIEEIASELKKQVKAHIKIDTGLSRYGFNYKEIESIKIMFENKKMINFEGIYTHFSSSLKASNKKSKLQYERFINLINILKENSIDFKLKHICNSSGFFKYPEMHLNAARIGSAFYGVTVGVKANLLQTGLLQTRITGIRYLNKGDTIGYADTYIVKKNIKIAILPVGYYAGIGLELTDQRFKLKSKIKKILITIKELVKDNNVSVKIDNKYYKILGQIGMNDIVIDITGEDYKINDIVIINVKPKYINESIKRIYK